MTLHVQFLTMGMMFASGVGMGILFETYRVLTGQLRAPRWLISILDLVYWSVMTVLVFRALYFSNQGQLRLFVFIGLLAGGSFYWAFLREGTVWVIRALIRSVLWLAGLIRRLVELLIVKPIQLLYKCLMMVIGFLIAVAIFLYKIVVKLLYPVLFIFIRPLLFIWKKIRWPQWIANGWRIIRQLFQKWFRKS